MEEGVAPTDSRLRPDQRLMEEGNWNEANLVKQQLEEKQRMVRRERESTAEMAASDGNCPIKNIHLLHGEFLSMQTNWLFFRRYLNSFGIMYLPRYI